MNVEDLHSELSVLRQKLEAYSALALKLRGISPADYERQIQALSDKLRNFPMGRLFRKDAEANRARLEGRLSLLKELLACLQ